MKTDEFKRRMPRCARFDYKGIETELKYFRYGETRNQQELEEKMEKQGWEK